MPNYIKDLKTYLKRSYSQDLIDKCKNTTEDIACIAVEKEIDDIRKTTFIYLSKSVLSGEYILIKDFDRQIDTLMNIVGIESCDEDSILLRSLYQLLSDTREIFSHYHALVRKIEDKIKYYHEKVFISAIHAKRIRSLNDLYYDFVSIVLELSDIDHFIVSNDENRQKLILLRHTIDEKSRGNNNES